jgi:hypothetical protein
MLLQACTAAAATAHALAHVLHLTPQLGAECAAGAPGLSSTSTAVRQCVRQRLSPSIVMLNRVLLEPDECTSEADGRLVARLSSDDPRTEHLRSHIKAESGKLLRAGIIDAGTTDAAKVEWEGGVDDGSAAMRLELGPADELLKPVPDARRPRLDLLLAVPRPPVLQRLVWLALQCIETVQHICAMQLLLISPACLPSRAAPDDLLDGRGQAVDYGCAACGEGLLELAPA